eukprot:3207690-Pleurochrysis_carterae.AAC.2
MQQTATRRNVGPSACCIALSTCAVNSTKGACPLDTTLSLRRANRQSRTQLQRTGNNRRMFSGDVFMQASRLTPTEIKMEVVRVLSQMMLRVGFAERPP